MYGRVLKQMCDRVRTGQYVMTLHAEEEMDDDHLSIFDVENGLLMGEIVERQQDRDTSEWKYLVKGETLAGNDIFVVGKLSKTNKLVIITVYRG